MSLQTNINDLAEINQYKTDFFLSEPVDFVVEIAASDQVKKLNRPK